MWWLSWLTAHCWMFSYKSEKNTQHETTNRFYYRHGSCLQIWMAKIITIIIIIDKNLQYTHVFTDICTSTPADLAETNDHITAWRDGTHVKHLCGCQAPPKKALCVLLTCHLQPLLSWCGDTLFLEMMEPFVCHQRDSFTVCYSWMGLSSCRAKPVNVIRKLIHPIYE